MASQQAAGPVYLTPDGRRRLEEQVARYSAQVAAWRSGDAEGAANQDRGDAAERLIEADDLTPTQDLLAATRAILARAVPMPAGPADGIVRLGSTVTVRDESGNESRLMVVDAAEFHDGERQVAADSPVGRALLGQARGSQIAVDVPAGRQMLKIESVEPYQEPAP
jgi:transcription elongation GreA/GreB family factor